MNCNLHNENLLSLKDTNKKVDIGDDKWHALFSILNRKFEFCYFRGYRLINNDERFKFEIKRYQDSIVELIPDFHDILIDVTDSSMGISRRALARIWYFYEYPSLLYFRDLPDFSKLKNQLQSQLDYQTFSSFYSESVLIYASFENDVIWILKNTEPSDNLFNEIVKTFKNN